MSRRLLRFGDGVLSRRAYKQDRKAHLGVVLEASDEGVLVGWDDGGEDFYPGLEVRWNLHPLGDGATRAALRPVVDAGGSSDAPAPEAPSC
jgi:hypothetical protein